MGTMLVLPMQRQTTYVRSPVVRIDRPISAQFQTPFVAASSFRRQDRSHDYPPISMRAQMKNASSAESVG